MRIAITGASGFIGRGIISGLEKTTTELILVGRNAELLKQLFPEHQCIDYQSMPKHIIGCDAIIHLAALVSTKNVELSVFQKANVELIKRVASAASNAKVPVFVNVATFGMHDNRYSHTKELGELALKSFKSLNVITLRLPGVYGETFKGRLGFLNNVPKIIRRPLFLVLASLRPTVHIEKVGNAVLEVSSATQSKEEIVTDRQIGNWFYAAIKRLIDLCFAGFVIILLGWLLVAAWVVIKLSFSGPGIFAQERIGKNGNSFICYKFRTMTVGTKQTGTHDVTKDSITPIGRILRKTKIDELPQVWNILKNDMSLVGPRPSLPVQDALKSWRAKLGVFDIKPGITGWAQIHHVDMSDPEKLAKLDAAYINLRTLILDAKIILATAIGSGRDHAR